MGQSDMMGVVFLIKDGLLHARHIFSPDPVASLEFDVPHHLLPRIRCLFSLCSLLDSTC